MDGADPDGSGQRGVGLHGLHGWWAWMFAGSLFGTAAFFWPSGIDPFLLPKESLLVAGAVTVLLAFAIARALSRVGRVVHVPPLIVAFGAWALLAPAGVSRNRSLHLLGASILGALLLVAILAQALREEHGAGGLRLVFGAVSLTVGFIGVLSLLQALGLDPVQALLGLKPGRPGRWRILTTLGNPNWTAEVLAAGLPLALASLAASRFPERWRRSVMIVVAILTAIAAGVTGSRGGLVALSAGAAVFWILAGPVRHGLQVIRMLVFGLVLLAAGSAAALSAGASRWSSLAPVTGRLGLWAAGGRLVVAAPLRGHGLGQIELVLPGALERIVSRAAPSVRRWLPSTLAGRLDDDVLQTAVAGGVPAALLLLAIYAVAVRRSWVRAGRNDAIPDAGIAGSLIALGIVSLVSSPLHTPATAILFWMLVGLSLARDRQAQRAYRGHTPAWLPVAIAIGLVPVTLTAAMAAGRALQADTQAGRGRRLLLAGQPAQAMGPLRAALDAAPWLGSAYGDLAQALLDTGDARGALTVVGTGERWTTSERLWTIRARALARLGRRQAALRQVERGLGIVPSSKILREEKVRLMHMRHLE